MTSLNNLYNEIADGIRVHHASGHFDHETAHTRLTAQTGCDAHKADLILAAPTPDRMYRDFGTFPPGGIRVACQQCADTPAAHHAANPTDSEV